ncbi:MAG: isocitrate lyase/phosphoenolpyruvate mutase family protein [Pseudomonadota bacterium]
MSAGVGGIGTAFRALHGDFFVAPNPWDGASAKLLAGMGFSALASSSAAIAWGLGRTDGGIGRQEAIANAKMIFEATGLPVNGDFEAGYGETPVDVADTIKAAIDAGVAGCSIEDIWRGGETPLYDEAEACRRLEAARTAIDRSSADFVLTGRCEAILARVPDAQDVVMRRLKLYADVGADVLYARGLASVEAVAAVVGLSDLPVSVIAGLGGVSNDLAALRALGVKRITLGSNLVKVAYGAFIEAGEALREGRVALDAAVPSSRIEKAMRGQ